ncbi:MAG: Gfo/Idh/MocA family oxidoreductase, partial [Planctomycetaceae bacterium]|nr:Gfo/Idh/MocA family oxidoreductase [Planctomycetaceae bacterium]
MSLSRRSFITNAALGAGLLTAGTGMAMPQNPTIAGFDDTKTEIDESKPWEQKFDRKIKMGLAGFGVCQFATAFSLQNHPNVEIVAVSDLISERCAALAQATKCEKTYPSVEEMVKDDNIEAIFIATDAASHGRLCLEVMKHGKHVATAVPATWGNLEEADMLYEMVKKTGLTYMMFETSAYHDKVFASRQIYKAGGFGKLIYTEGEYYHYFPTALDSYKGWRVGLPPQYYPTHSNAYYVAITGGSFTEVSCMGNRSIVPHLMPENNAYQNPFGSEIALFRTSEGGMARMAVCWDAPQMLGEQGRISGEKGNFWGNAYIDMRGRSILDTDEPIKSVNWKKPALPPAVDPGGHGGSHGYLGNEFVMSILENRKPLVNIAWSLNMTVAGIVARQSALKDGELLKIPQ